MILEREPVDFKEQIANTHIFGSHETITFIHFPISLPRSILVNHPSITLSEVGIAIADKANNNSLNVFGGP